MPRPFFVGATRNESFKDKALGVLEPALQHMCSALMHRNISQGSFSLAFANGDPPSVVTLVNVARRERTKLFHARAGRERQPNEVVKDFCVSLCVGATQDFYQGAVSPLAPLFGLPARRLLVDAVSSPGIVDLRCQAARFKPFPE